MASLPRWAHAGKGSDDWNLGSIDHAMYAAWSAVVDYLVWLGGLLAREHVTVHAMTEDLSQRYCLFLFDLAGMDSYQGVELYNRAGLRIHNRVRNAYSRHTLEAMDIEAGFRLSANHANSPAEVDVFLAATEEISRMPPEEVAKVTAGDRGPGVRKR